MQDGKTAVMGAAGGGHLSVVEYLVGRGADIEAKHNVRDRLCDSHCAVMSDRVRLCTVYGCMWYVCFDAVLHVLRWTGSVAVRCPGCQARE